MVGLITHDWIENDGGAEKVLQSFTDLFPSADLFTLWDDTQNGRYKNRIIESKLSNLNLKNRKLITFPIMPLIWNQVDTSQYDWILSSTHLFAHHVNAKSENRIIKKCIYVHTPARYLWDPSIDARGNNYALRVLAKPFKGIDRKRAQNSDSIAANSIFVKNRIKSFWERDSIVIYPPVEVKLIQSKPNWENCLASQESDIVERLNFDFLFAASRLVKYKQIEKAIQFAKWNDIPIVIAGNGPEFENLQNIASKLRVHAIFLGRISDTLMRVLYRRALAYIFPPIEDFGIMPVEAMAAGGVVVANQIGGTSETIQHGTSGLLVNFDDKLLCKQIFSQISPKLRSGAATRASKFSREIFDLEILDWLSSNKISKEY